MNLPHSGSSPSDLPPRTPLARLFGCLILPAWEPLVCQPLHDLGGGLVAMRNPRGKDLHDGLEGVLGAILTQVGALEFDWTTGVGWRSWQVGSAGVQNTLCTRA